MILGIFIGIIFSFIVYGIMNPCEHKDTYYVMKCKKCFRVLEH